MRNTPQKYQFDTYPTKIDSVQDGGVLKVKSPSRFPLPRGSVSLLTTKWLGARLLTERSTEREASSMSSGESNRCNISQDTYRLILLQLPALAWLHINEFPFASKNTCPSKKTETNSATYVRSTYT